MRQTERHAGGLRAALTIARRDLVEFVRDRRTLFITLLLPMVTYPILALSTALGLRTASSEIEAQRAPTKIVVTVSGSDAAALVDRIDFVKKKTTASGREGWPSAIEMEVVTAAAARGRLDRQLRPHVQHREMRAAKRRLRSGTCVLRPRRHECHRHRRRPAARLP